VKAKAVAALLLLAAMAGAAQARDADPVAVGRYHLRKANQLAGEDHCHSAIHEYTLAFQKLKDPVVLFNRGECYRRIGQADKAVSDYRAFLEAVPAAPNRADIESRIAALSPTPAPVAPVRPPVRSPAPAAPAPARTAEAAPPPPRAPIIEEPPPAPQAPPVVLASPAAAATPSGADDRPAEHHAHTAHTWVWIALGAAVAGGAVGAYFALRPPTTTPPVTDLGNYKF
jgi:hypothetical protein